MSVDRIAALAGLRGNRMIQNPLKDSDRRGRMKESGSSPVYPNTSEQICG